ncbi:hypothetical protein Btru_064462 [Bulinus truncatus]|nr:hypothetical protein Btru_064462 [Bulinus truncatus]
MKVLYDTNVQSCCFAQLNTWRHNKKFECSHCNNRFASERILRDHMRHHVNHYKCPLCDMTCHSPSTVRDHVKYRHSDERNYKCGSCEYSGKTQTDLCRHMATHSDKGPFACKREGCEMVFITSLELRDHYKNHEDFGKQQYECHICKKRCVRGTILTTHLMEKHNYKWPSGHSKFRYRLHDDGVRRLQTIRYESIEVSEQVLSQDLTVQQAKSSSEAESAESGHIPTPNFTDITAFLPSQHQNSSKNKKCIEKAKSLKSKAPKRKGKANDLGSGGPGSKKRKTCAPKLGPVGVTQGDELMNGSIETKSSINERVSDVSSGVSEGAASIHSEHPEAIGFEKSVMAPANLLTVSCAGISGTPDRNGTPGPASIHPASLCQPKMQSLKVATDLRDADPDNESLVDPSFSSTISGSITQPAWSHFHEFSPLKVNPSLQDSLVSSDSVLRTPVKYTNEACNSSAGIVHLTCLNHKAEDSQPKNTQVWSADVASRGETDIQQLVRPQSSTMTFLHPACTTFTSYCSPSKLDSPAHVNLVSSDICGLDNKSSELYNLEMLGEVAINIQEVAREEK